ncbi:hypothetical protein FQZ97_738210 [compost metagenome]
MHVVGQVVDVVQAMADRVQLGAGQRIEVDVVEADVADVALLGAVLATPAVDEIDDGVADALDGRDVQLARTGRLRVAPGAQRNGALVGGLGIAHAQRDRAHTGAMQACEALRKAVGLGVDDEVDLPLAVQRHGLVAVLRDRFEAHALEQGAHGHRVGRGVFDELKTVGAHGVLPFGDGVLGGSGQGVVHGSLRWARVIRHCIGAACHDSGVLGRSTCPSCRKHA